MQRMLRKGRPKYLDEKAWIEGHVLAQRVEWFPVEDQLPVFLGGGSYPGALPLQDSRVEHGHVERQVDVMRGRARLGGERALNDEEEPSPGSRDASSNGVWRR